MPQNKFKSTTPVSNTPTGVSMKDILSFAAGKQDGSLTASDIESVIQRSNIRGKDAKSIRKAAANFVDSGNDYRMQEDGNYNVYGDGQQVSSSRSTGNKVGFNPGDVVGLGNNMSKLAGLAKMYRGAFDESKKPKEALAPQSAPSTPVANASMQSQSNTPQKPSKGVSGARGSTVKPSDLVKSTAGPSADFEAKLQAFREGKNPNRFTGVVPGKIEDHMAEVRKKLSNSFNSVSGGWQGAHNVSTNSPFHMGQSLSTKEFDNSKQNMTNNAARLYEEMLSAGETPDLNEIVKAINDEEFTSLVSFNEQNAKTTASVLSYLPLGRGIMIAGKAAGKILPKVVAKYPTLGRWMANKIKMPPVVRSTAGELAEKSVVPKQVSTWGTPIFRKGGKLPKGENGMKVNVKPGVSSLAKSATQPTKKKPADLLGMDWKQYNNNLRANIPQMATATTAADIPVTDDSGNYQSADLSGNGQNVESGGKALDVFGKVAKYTLPFIGTHLANRELGKVKSVNFKPAQLMAGVVSDIPRPNMGLRYREPVGNDLQSQIAGQKFGDAQQRDAEANYQVANAQSRIAQQQQVVNNLNRNEMYNNQGENNARFFNAQQLMGLQSMRAQNAQEPWVAAQHHLATDISTDAYLKSSREMESAEMILKTADPGSPEYQQALKKLGYGQTTPKGKKGMKFKIKC